MDSMKIKVPTGNERDGVTTVDEWGRFFTDEELVEIVHRYCNTQDGSKKYREKAAEKNKIMKALLEKAGMMEEVNRLVG